MLRNKWPTANEEQSEPIDHNVDMIVNPQPPTPQADNMQSDQSPIRIALFGYGVVGQGFHKALQTAGGNFVLDFESGNLENLAKFYKGFGAVEEVYYWLG